MTLIKELQEQLLTSNEKHHFSPNQPLTRESGIIVLKNYKFHKQLSLELYTASTTQANKLKNPLIRINPLDSALKTQRPDELKFFSAVSRFQNNPTASKLLLDTEALKVVMSNPLNLRCFYHNATFSENVVAGSLEEVSIGEIINDVTLFIHKKEECYEIFPQVTIQGKPYHFNEVELKYDNFILVGETIHLLGKIHLLKLFRFFKQVHPGLIRVQKPWFKEFQLNILAKLEDCVAVVYTYLNEGTSVQIEEAGISQPIERLIYLSDLDSYVMISPVVKYGMMEIPVLTKRQIYAEDREGKLFTVQRNDDAEIHFTALLLKQHPDFEEQLQN